MRVTATETPGVYTIAGNTTLPDNTRLNVAAIRYLYPGDAASATFNPDPTYSILAYQFAQVQKGEWQTKLNLWQVASNGQFKEAWQLSQPKLGLSFKPDEAVVFMASLAPITKLSELEQQLSRKGLKFPGGTIRTTSEGERYAQVNQLMAIALPSGNTSPSPPRPEEINYGWGYRYLIPLEPQNPYNLEFPDKRQTDAPPKPNEFLQ